MITVPFTTLRKGFDHSTLVLEYQGITAMHPEDRCKCAYILKEALEYTHWNNNKAGRLEVSILKVTEEEVTLEMEVHPV